MKVFAVITELLRTKLIRSLLIVRSIGSSISQVTMTSQGNAEIIECGVNGKSIKPTGRYRLLLPQILATIPTSLLMANIGAAVGYSTIINSALRGLNPDMNPDETLQMTVEEISWLGSTAYLTKLVGGLMCGWVSDPLGRKNAMLMVNVPVMISWALFYYSKTVTQIFIANCLLAFASGFMKTPCVTYTGEVCTSSARGILVSVGSASTTIAPLIIFVLGTVTAWRNISLYAAVFQIITLATLFLIPESPIWLMTKNRDDRALSSLKWLRGWRIDERVENEYSDMRRYKEFVDACPACKKAKIRCTHPPPTMAQNLKELIKKKTIKPFLVFTICGFFAYTCGSHHLQSYFVQIMNAYQSPIDPNQAAVVIGLVAVIATFVCIPLIRVFGKRKLFLISSAGVVLSMTALVIYGFLYLPPNIKSYDNKKADPSKEVSVIPLVLFCILRFFTIPTTMIIMTMLGELFPLKIRSIASGITTAIVNVLTFAAIRTFYDFEYLTSLPGAFSVYAVAGAFGLVISYMILPETEGLSLEDIEMHFSNDKLGLTDRVIVPQDRKAKKTAINDSTAGHDNEAFSPDK